MSRRILVGGWAVCLALAPVAMRAQMESVPETSPMEEAPALENPAEGTPVAPADPAPEPAVNEAPASEAKPAVAEPVIVKPPVPVVPAVTPAPPPAPKAIPVPRDSMGRTDGIYFIGQRTVVDRYAGWGWIKEERQSWRSAKWIMVQETPGQVVAPHRFLGSSSADDAVQYRLYGRFADYKGYEPNFDVFVDVFLLEGFEKIGPGNTIKREPPRSTSGSRESIATQRRTP